MFPDLNNNNNHRYYLDAGLRMHETWRKTICKQRQRPRPLSGKIICAPAPHSPYKAAYQIWSL